MSDAAVTSAGEDLGLDLTWDATLTLAEILDHVRLALRSDTATVLAVDGARTGLETIASVGLDRPARTVPRIPFGKGFVGRIAISRQPLTLSEVTPATVADLDLVRHSITRLLGAPIVSGGELLGVLRVGRKAMEDFTDDDMLHLSEHANALAPVLKQRVVSQGHAAALTLQRSLLPDDIQARPGIRISARYIPARGDLGGDWYDVFDLPDGQLVLVMGDVAGHGLEAAVIMGRLRSALRSYALESDDPADILRRLDRKICYFEPGALATVVLGIAAPPYEEWRISSAGHLPPMIASPGGTSRAVAIESDRLLGVDPDRIRHSVAATVPPGGSLCLYTDGLVERRPGPGEDAIKLLDDNLGALAAALDRSTEPEMACINILSDLVGEESMEDDLALVVAQRTGGSRHV